MLKSAKVLSNVAGKSVKNGLWEGMLVDSKA